MDTINFDGIEYSINDLLTGFIICQKTSSNVDFFGIHAENSESSSGQFFVQFRNGSSYIYNDVPVLLLTESIAATSIGKFISQNIIGKYTANKFPNGRLLQVHADA